MMKSSGAVRRLPDAEATEALGVELSLFIKPGDVIALSGDLGAGKTTLARAIIRALAPEAGAFEVPSPTFTLAQAYEFTRVPITHFDLYRLSDESEAIELGFLGGLRQSACVVEWPERAEGLLPQDLLTIELSDPETAGRIATITANGDWADRIDRMETVRKFLEGEGLSDCARYFLKGDASTRRYERLASAPPTILMDSPAQPDGPPVRDGKPYSQIAHLAENVTAFAAMAKGLCDKGLSAPEVIASDLQSGLLVIEDFGDDVFGAMLKDPANDMSEPYQVAVDVLCHLANQEPQADIAVEGTGTYTIPAYDHKAMEIEAELLLDWFWPAVYGEPAPQGHRDEFLQAWRAHWPELETHRPVWVLRDYHSPNLMWLPERDGLKRVGLLDFQDGLMGHPAYDLVSLLQDARVDVPADVERDLLDYYCAARGADDPKFDEEAFRRAYSILALQRNSKILGIFVRLKQRDGKDDYLKHIPRLSRYVTRTLKAGHLPELKAWFEEHLPADKRETLGQD
ncbi:MAG: tRNA (adenosine(37)-N6)-threonylcarbamoyltransferase complex ATPase subunit type 1 TsaE [Hyphomicrobiales bacterium]